jgi:hypothetical protein
MLDDLRNSSAFIDEEEPLYNPEETAQFRPSRREQGLFLGLTAQQRFILSVMLFFMVCALGVMALWMSGSIYIRGL